MIKKLKDFKREFTFNIFVLCLENNDKQPKKKRLIVMLRNIIKLITIDKFRLFIVVLIYTMHKHRWD